MDTALKDIKQTWKLWDKGPSVTLPPPPPSPQNVIPSCLHPTASAQRRGPRLGSASDICSSCLRVQLRPRVLPFLQGPIPLCPACGHLPCSLPLRFQIPSLSRGECGLGRVYLPCGPAAKGESRCGMTGLDGAWQLRSLRPSGARVQERGREAPTDPGGQKLRTDSYHCGFFWTCPPCQPRGR